MNRALDSLPGTYSLLAESLRRSLLAQNKSSRTVETYMEALNLLGAFLHDNGMPLDDGHIKREHVEAFIADLLAKWKPATASNRYRALASFWKWCLKEGEIKRSPMERMKPPTVPVEPPKVIGADRMKQLLKTCSGQTFDARRDAAIIMLLWDCGLRRAELTNLKMEDVDWKRYVLVVIGKGQRKREAPFGKATGRALDRYIRVRARHPKADRPELWLGHMGPMTDSAIYRVVKRRAQQAGLEGVYTHLFRHSFAHEHLSAGMQETDLMRLAGWNSRNMLQRYGARAADQRAKYGGRIVPPSVAADRRHKDSTFCLLDSERTSATLNAADCARRMESLHSSSTAL